MSGGRTLTDSNSIVWSILVADQVAALRTALTGDVTADQDSSATTISANAVTNAKLATMADSTFKMRAAGTGTGDPIDGTAAQAKAALAIDHGADLAGLTDDDHTQYAFLAGRVGGQTLVGGTAAGDDLLLSSTANATKGTIRLGSATTGLFFDEVNSRLALSGSGENTVTINGTAFGEAFVVHATSDVEIGAHRHTATAGFGASLYGVRSRGTEGAETAVQNNDTVLFLSAAAHDGTDYAFCGQILFEIDGTPGNNDMPGRIVFKTTADGASTTTEALRLSSDQSATFAGVVTVTNTGLHLLDTNASHDLIIKPGSDLTADRTLTVTTGDKNCSLYADNRETLTANRTYYVRTDGSDSNTGLADSAGGAFLTLQKAYDVVADTLDLGAYEVTIQVRDGTYTVPGGGQAVLFIARPWVGGKSPGGVGGTGGGSVHVVGNTTTPANCILSAGTSKCLFVNCGLPNTLDFSGFKLQGGSNGTGIFNNGPGSIVNISEIDFGAFTTGTSSKHMWAAQASVIFLYNKNYTISGSVDYHAFCEVGGAVDVELGTITLSGTPNFATAFVLADTNSTFYSAVTYSGSGTGKKFIARACGSIRVLDNTFGELGAAALTTLPGDVAGEFIGGTLNTYGGFDGLRIGFTGAPTADRVEVGDANFYLDYNGGNPVIILDSNDYILYDRASNTLVFHPGNVDRFLINGNGMPIWLPGSATPATLGTNGQITMTLTSNTNLRFSARGSDGVTRVANITLA